MLLMILLAYMLIRENGFYYSPKWDKGNRYTYLFEQENVLQEAAGKTMANGQECMKNTPEPI